MTSAVITTLQFPHSVTPEDHTFIFCFTALHDTNSVLYLIFISITFVFHILDFCSDNFQGRYLFHPKLYFLIHNTAVFSSILKTRKFFMSTQSFLINSVFFFGRGREQKFSMFIVYGYYICFYLQTSNNAEIFYMPYLHISSHQFTTHWDS